MKKNGLLVLSIVLMLVLSSCASAQRSATNETIDSSRSAEGGMAYSEAVSPAEAPSAAAPDTATTGAASSSGGDQMIVKTASLTILVDDPSVSLSDLMKLVDEMGGYTVSSSKYQTYLSSGEQVPAAYATVRVPSGRLTDALDQIKALTGDPGKYVTDESVSGQDVTQTYTDLGSRLRNLEEAEVELSALYDKAVDTDDILAIYNKKMEVTEQIEVIKGQMQYYEEASTMAAITVQINAKASVQPITVAGWEPKGVARNAIQALINFFKGFVNFLIWLGIYILPILIIIGLPIFFLVRWLVRRNRRAQEKRKQMPPMPSDRK